MSDSDGCATRLLTAGKQNSYASCDAEPVLASEVPEEPPRFREAIRSLLAHSWFEPSLALVALLDSAAVGVEIDYPDLCSRAGWLSIATAFNLVFTIEIALRILAHGPTAFYTTMHATRALVTVLAWLELLACFSAKVGLLPGVVAVLPASLVQVFRLMRACRIAMISDEFRVMVQSLVPAISEIFWVVFLLLLCFILAACATTVFIGRSPDKAAAAEFSTMGASLFTLLRLALMEGWVDIVKPLWQDHWEWVAALVAFIFAANMGLLNLLTAVVVERTCEARALQEEHQRKDEKAKELEMIDELHSQLLAYNGGPHITHDRFEEWLKSPGAGAELMIQLEFSRSYMRSAYIFCDQQHREGRVSLSSMKCVWEDSKMPLTMASCIRFKHHLVRRVEHIEKLNSLVLTAASQLALQKAGAAKASGRATK